MKINRLIGPSPSHERVLLSRLPLRLVTTESSVYAQLVPGGQSGNETGVGPVAPSVATMFVSVPFSLCRPLVWNLDIMFNRSK